MKEVRYTPSQNAIALNEIAVLILSTKSPRYKEFQQAVRCTWKRRLIDAGVHVYFYAGDHVQNEVVGDVIHLDTSDKLEATAEKLKSAIKTLYAMHPNVKLIYRTNLSSYIDVDNFLKYIERNKLGEMSYSGVIGETTLLREYFYGNRLLHTLFRLIPIGPRITFASGSGFFIGTEYARELVDSQAGNQLIDDVMVAKVLNVSPSAAVTPMRIDVQENGSHKMPPDAYYNLLREKLLFHYRFKTRNRQRDVMLLKSFDDPSVRYDECTTL